jgi:SsrA-binding protein
MPNLATNKDAAHRYHLLERLEAGIVLTGAEVKSAKTGNATLKGAYVRVRGTDAWLEGLRIGPYAKAPANAFDPDRAKRLLLRRTEFKKLPGRLAEAGVTLVPVSLYTKRGLIKVELALARGKKAHDKRASIKRREAEKRIRQALGRRR